MRKIQRLKLVEVQERELINNKMVKKRYLQIQMIRITLIRNLMSIQIQKTHQIIALRQIRIPVVPMAKIQMQQMIMIA